LKLGGLDLEEVERVGDIDAAKESGLRNAQGGGQFPAVLPKLGDGIPVSHEPDVLTDDALNGLIENVAGRHIVKLHEDLPVWQGAGENFSGEESAACSVPIYRKGRERKNAFCGKIGKLGFLGVRARSGLRLGRI
jgi:hypothetical protein